MFTELHTYYICPWNRSGKPRHGEGEQLSDDEAPFWREINYVLGDRFCGLPQSLGMSSANPGSPDLGSVGGAGLLLFHVGNGWCQVSGAVETSPPNTEPPPFPALECCRIGLLRTEAFVGGILVFQVVAQAWLTGCPQLLLIDLSSLMGQVWSRAQGKAVGFEFRVIDCIYPPSPAAPSPFLSLFFVVWDLLLISAQIGERRLCVV